MVKREENELFGEIEWSAIEDGVITNELVKTERKFTFYAIIIVIGLLALIPFTSFLVSEEELRSAYITEYNWLNQCNANCQSKVDLEFLDKSRNCEALTSLYAQPHDNFAVEWGYAINDRATSLGCPGFPKGQEQVKTETKQVAKVQAEKIDAQQSSRRQKLLEELNSKQPRFATSITDGNLGQYVADSYQDSQNEGTMIIIMTPVWENILQRKRLQLARAIWQKWVNIYNPSSPDSSFIQLRNSSGALIGGSNINDSSDIWVRRD